MIQEAVRSGTGTRAQVQGYRVAGKTGTAWKPHPAGGYGEEDDDVRYVASFAGFLPADAPELVVLVIIDEPAGHSYSGGRAAAPVFSEFSKFAVRQLRIPAAEERMEMVLDTPERVMEASPAQALPATVATQLAVASSVG
jgi:cell division protein FtsI/penicillin-binding protein 2